MKRLDKEREDAKEKLEREKKTRFPMLGPATLAAEREEQEELEQERKHNALMRSLSKTMRVGLMRQAVEEVGREKMREKEMEKGMLMREKNMKETREQVEEKGGKEDVERWAREMGGEDWKGLLPAY